MDEYIKHSDVVNVVRCKDCKHLMFSDCYGECRRNHIGIVRPDDYCSYGERKDGDESVSKVKYRFEFEVSDSWKAGETACWTECPFSPLIGLGHTCKFLTTKELKCPFRDNKFKNLFGVI